MTVTHSQHKNGTDCLTLTDTGRTGGFLPHGGTASIVDRFNQRLTGEFTIVNKTLIVGIGESGGLGEAGQPFIIAAPATGGDFCSGSYENYLGQEAIDSGAVALLKAGC